MTSIQYDSWTEPAIREGDGPIVSLRWSRSIHVAGGDALVAFHHPFAYAAAPGAGFRHAVTCRAPRLTTERSAA
jgi:hypothetical protein